MKKLLRMICLTLALCMLAGCGTGGAQPTPSGAFRQTGETVERSKKALTNIRATIHAFFKMCRLKKVSTLFPENLSIPKGARYKGTKILQPQDLITLVQHRYAKLWLFLLYCLIALYYDYFSHTILSFPSFQVYTTTITALYPDQTPTKDTCFMSAYINAICFFVVIFVVIFKTFISFC